MTPGTRELEPSLLPIGEEFAGYRVDAGLGRQHGIGRVYRATHRDTGREVALKVFSPQALSDAGLRRHFFDSARFQTKLHHPAVVPIADWGARPVPYMAMKLVPGPTLADLIARGELDDRRALHIVSAVAAALGSGLRAGLLYRRLQPSGVLVDVEKGDRAYLGDFGAGRPAHAGEALENGRLGGFADYISPEEAADGEATTASLVYSLGAMIFQTLTGQVPYPAHEQWATLRAHLEAPPRSVRELRPQLPEALDAALQQAMAKEPSARQASPGELMREVDEAYPPDARVTDLAAPSRKRRRLPRPATLALAAAVLALGVVGGALAGGASTSDPGPRAPKAVRAPSLSLRYPADWTVSRTASAVPGVRLADAVSVSPAGTLGDGELVAGRVAGGSLPASGGQIVDLGAVTGRRYTGLRETGSQRRVVAYAVPGADGTVVAACFEQAGAGGAFAGRCARAASTLRARRPGPPLIAPDPRFSRQMAGAVRRIQRVRAQGRSALARARTRGAQAAPARRLRRDYRTLAGVLARIDAPGGARGPTRMAVAQLRRASRGFGDMAHAARTKQPGRWNAARAGVRSAESRFQAALRRLRGLGYDVG
jgi:hypothetical protein